MESLKNVISSFDIQNNLNPKFWDKDETKLNPKVRRHLLEIADQFINSFGIDVLVDDIIIKGSLTNYNWSKYSDIDLHVVVDYKQFPIDLRELYVEFFDLKKIVFNQKRQLSIFGYDIESYVEGVDDEGTSNGIYSLMRDEWIKKPEKENIKVSKEEIIKNSKRWMRLIDTLIKNLQGESIDEINSGVKTIKDKLKKYRKSGLQKGGEMSIENLVFKVLRRNGFIEKLYNVPIKVIDKKLSLRETVKTIPGGFSVDLDMGPTYHSSRKLGNWESDNAWDMYAPVGTEVYSYTKGTVSKKKDYGSNSGKIYGIGVVIKGTDGYPNIFYTHIKNVDIEIGDSVDVGDYIGEIAAWPGNPGGEHVHIGLPYGEKLEDYILGMNPNLRTKRYEDEEEESEEFDEIKNDIFDKNPELEKNNTSEVLNNSEKSKFMKDFLELSKSDIGVSQEDKVITKNTKIQKLQIGLQFLDYLDFNYGIDGFYDEKTINALNDFRAEFNLSKSNKITSTDILYMYFLLLYNLFDDIKLSKINQIPNYDKLKLTTINNFYQMVLIWLNVDITYSNINFLNAWDEATTVGGEQNPFGLQYIKEKNISSPIFNTLEVLNSSQYSCVRFGLTQNKKINEILNCPIFDKDNLREKIKNFLRK